MLALSIRSSSGLLEVSWTQAELLPLCPRAHLISAAVFYWMESVQAYNEGGWDYTTELINFVNGGMSGNGFIDGVSGIVNRGCHNPVSSRSIQKFLLQCAQSCHQRS